MKKLGHLGLSRKCNQLRITQSELIRINAIGVIHSIICPILSIVIHETARIFASNFGRGEIFLNFQ